MTDDIKAIGQRIRGLRDTFNVSAASLASDCGLSEADLAAYEKSELDIPVGILNSIAKRFGVELTTLLTGDEPHLKNYCLTRRDSGVTVNRRIDYQYKSLAYTFSGRKAEPFMVTVEPSADGADVHQNSHDGQEFNYVLSGRLLIRLKDTDFVLNEGDSMYFNSNIPHGMKAMDGKNARFLACIF
jgi:quercetin dioxygenase-like cupin family protein